MPQFVTPYETLLLVALAAYLLGSIPFGMVIAKVMNLGNLREIGSGNIGATNVLRTGNKLAALLTVIFDAGKGAVAVLIARAWLGEDAAQIAGLAAFLGHLFPVWLRFKGGKGVATFLGIMLALHPFVGALSCVTWLVVAVSLRMSSLAALMTAAILPIWIMWRDAGELFLLALILTVLIYNRHWGNMQRIKAGTEPKIGE